MADTIITIMTEVPPTIIHEGYQGIQGAQGIQGERGEDGAMGVADYSELTGKPVLSNVAISGYYDDLLGTPNLAPVALSNSYNDLIDKPNIADTQVQSDWTASTGLGAILNKPNLSNVATSGSYNDLTNKPTFTSTIAGATDVVLTSPSNYQVLSYNLTLDKWVNANPVTGGGSAYDVAVANGYVGTESAWLLTLKATAIVVDYADILNKPTITSTIAGATDVVLTSPTNGQTLVYNSTLSKWVNGAGGSGGGSGGFEQIFLMGGM